MTPDNGNESVLLLAENILENTKAFSKYFESSNVALPMFSPKAQQPPSTPEFEKLQTILSAQLEDLQLLVNGPPRFYRNLLMRGYEIAAFQIALDFGFFTLVPSEGHISAEDLANKAGLDQDRTSRILRLLITNHFFQEISPGFFSHNSFSIALQRDDEIRAMVHYSFDEMLKASAESSVALKANPFEADSVHCPFFARFGIPIFDSYREHPEQSGRFARAMAGWRKMVNNLVELQDNYRWADLEGTVVDIGGGSGHVSMQLARHVPHLKFVVQDDGDAMLAQGQRLLTDGILDRISFTKASFFEPQKYMPASAYLIRQCTHNWADHDVITMLRAVVPGLEGSPPGTPLLINDMILPEAGSRVPRIWERERRQADILMLICYGAKQRTVAEFKALLNEADPRYMIRKIHEQGALGLLEVYLDIEKG
ncbi:S-adenosyl-L-methionine-dependent methyltransferase [Xylariaceae sp. AK1471]|nr:S-adenosyl-L-methionine-dependent methyltransferase [Xylariaceae sp. AK1471]